MEIAITGFDREGRSTLKLLKSKPEFRGAEIWILDKNPKTAVPRGLRSRLGKYYLDGLERFDVVFRTPGIPYHLPALRKARGAGVKIGSATKLFFYEARRLASKPLIVGITGTKGKGTVSTLLYNMLRAAGKKVFLGGNIGTSALELLPQLQRLKAVKGPRPIVILELSSFQLHDLDASPDIAVVLDIFPDHQDAHKNVKEYYDAKANIARFQSAKDKIFFFKNHRLSGAVAKPGRGKKIAVDEKTFRLFAPGDLAMPGYHNFKNAVMAAAVARSLGVPAAAIKKIAVEFAGNEHRLEFVRRVGGVSFYNDSASTNPQTSAAAVKAFSGSSRILIAGGKDKNLDYAPLAQAIRESRVKAVVLFGENRKKIFLALKPALKDFGIPAALAPGLRSAIRHAYGAARRIARRNKGTPLVLFSPGAASFDMFKNYADRGERFKDAVRKLK